MNTLRHRLEEAGAHAMRLRAVEKMPRPFVELHVLPVGIEIDVRHDGRAMRRERRLVGWPTIESARINILVVVMDELADKVGTDN